MSQWHFAELQQAIEPGDSAVQEASVASQTIGFRGETANNRNVSNKLRDIRLLRM
jgi:hypothetical protein